MSLAEHPTVRRFHESHGEHPGPAESPQPLDAAWLRQLCLDCGADDAGLVEISRPALDDQRADILRAFPPAKSLLSFVCRMNREPIRSPPGRSPTWSSTTPAITSTRSPARSWRRSNGRASGR